MTAFLYKPLLYCYIFLGSFWVDKPATTAFHPLHVSTSDISYNAQDGQMEVICTIFTDDFESALEKQFHTKADLSKADMHTAMDALVKNYIAANLHLAVADKGVALNYVGFEINREAVNVYLESPKIAAAPKKITADVSILQSLYTDQLNIVHMTVAGNRKSARLDNPVRKITQEF